MSKLRKLLPSFNALLVFEVSARMRSFKLAAEELNVTQPSVSSTIKSLEEHLGFRLFQRNNRGVELTSAGLELASELSPALERIELKLKSLSDRNSDTLTIAASTSVSAQWLLPKTSDYKREHGDLSISIITTDRNLDPSDDLDFSIRRGPKNWDRPNCWHLSDEELYLICSPSYRERFGPIRGLSDLANHKIIHNAEPYRKRMDWREWLDAQGCSDIKLPVSLVLNDYQLVLQACVAGEGVALGWSFTTRALIEAGFLEVPIENTVCTDFAFYIIAPTWKDVSKNKLNYVRWLSKNTD
jgi:LysR family glycine cleavage system transcriptional activator